MTFESLNYYYQITATYKGTRYLGWQVQPNGPTVQGEINKCLMELFKSNEIKTVGAGRTDAGVHAFGQVFKATVPFKISEEGLLKGLNSLLPPDINVLDVITCEESFHPVFSAVKKEYLYYFYQADTGLPIQSELMARYPFKDFDFSRMEKGAKIFEGEHDFCNYFCKGTPTKTTTRRIYQCSLESVQGDFPEHLFQSDYFLFRITGNGFLKQMVRLIVGAIWNVGRNKVSLDEIKKSLEQPLSDSKKLGAVAPPEGLYLNKVFYEENS